MNEIDKHINQIKKQISKIAYKQIMLKLERQALEQDLKELENERTEKNGVAK